MFWEALRNLLVKKVLRKSWIVDSIVEFGGEKGVEFILYFSLQLLAEVVISFQIEGLGTDEVGQ